MAMLPEAKSSLKKMSERGAMSEGGKRKVGKEIERNIKNTHARQKKRERREENEAIETKWTTWRR